MSFKGVYGDHSETKVDTSMQENPSTVIRTPRIDVYESESAYFLRLSIPGVKNDHLAIQFKKDSDLEIKGHVKSYHPEGIDQVVTKEIFEGPFYRLIRFPSDIEKDSLVFGYESGILTITISKSNTVGD